MKVRLFLVLALTMLFAIASFAGGESKATPKSTAQAKAGCCQMDKASSDKAGSCPYMNGKASGKMDCCKDAKGTKASNKIKASKKSVVKLAKDSK